MINVEKIQGCDCISWTDAERLCTPDSPPRPGHEKLVQYEGCHYWLQQVSLSGQGRWWIRKTPWRFNACKQAILDRHGIIAFEKERKNKNG